MHIFEVMHVIAKKTKRDGGNILFANSKTCNVGNIDDKEVHVYDCPIGHGCPIEEFRDYFLMTYCSSTHKRQGETITENNAIYDWKHMTTKI